MRAATRGGLVTLCLGLASGCSSGSGVASDWDVGKGGALPAGTAGAISNESNGPTGTAGTGEEPIKPDTGMGGSTGSGSPSTDVGPCGDTFIDYDCDALLEECPEGTHRDYDPAYPCAICVDDADPPLTCDAARTRYQEMLDHVIRNSCADFCESDTDCFVMELSNACARGCTYALFGGIDEEIDIIAEQFAAESCEPACGDAPVPECDPPEGDSVACVRNLCVFQ